MKTGNRPRRRSPGVWDRLERAEMRGRGDGFPLGADGEPDVWNTGAGGERIRAHHLASTRQRAGIPSQSWHATHHQWQGGSCDGFVTATQQVVDAPGTDQAAAAARCRRAAGGRGAVIGSLARG